MTTLQETTMKCGVCGQKSSQVQVASTGQFGSPDLDTRPPEMMRSTIAHWIQECPFCGYCAPSIAGARAGWASFVATDAYQTQRRNPEYPELANRFQWWSLIQEQAGDLASAAWAGVHAAWASDDNGNNAAARWCRVRAAGLFEKAIATKRKLSPQRGAVETVIADLWRRAGHFEKALESAERAERKLNFQAKSRARDPDTADDLEIIRKVLKFEKILIGRADSSSHTVAEAFDEEEIQRS